MSNPIKGCKLTLYPKHKLTSEKIPARCPFCGRKPGMALYEDNVSCMNKKCFMYSKIVTFNAWNTRTESALIAQLVGAAEQALVYIENDEFSHGRPFGAGNALRKALSAAKRVS